MWDYYQKLLLNHLWNIEHWPITNQYFDHVVARLCREIEHNVMFYPTPESGARKIWHQIVWQTLQKPTPVFWRRFLERVSGVLVLSWADTGGVITVRCGPKRITKRRPCEAIVLRIKYFFKKYSRTIYTAILQEKFEKCIKYGKPARVAAEQATSRHYRQNLSRH